MNANVTLGMMDETAGPKYPNVRVKLVGGNGNAFVLLGKVTEAMRNAWLPAAEISAFQKAAMSGDYDNLLRVCMEWVDVS